jgi:hypothetical protein
MSTPRPVIAISTDAPIDCPLDSGALRTRMSTDLAAFAGIDLTGALTEEFYVAGLKAVGSLAGRP